MSSVLTIRDAFYSEKTAKEMAYCKEKKKSLRELKMTPHGFEMVNCACGKCCWDHGYMKRVANLSRWSWDHPIFKMEIPKSQQSWAAGMLVGLAPTQPHS